MSVPRGPRYLKVPNQISRSSKSSKVPCNELGFLGAITSLSPNWMMDAVTTLSSTV